MARYQHEYGRFRSGLYHATIGNNPQDGDWLRSEDMPRFFITLEKATDSLDAALFDILLLLVFNALFFMLAYAFFLRYDVT